MARIRLPVLLAAGIVLWGPVARGAPVSRGKADATVKAALEKAGARPGGILRVQRFPLPLAKGWTVAEDREETSVRLEAEGPSWLYFVDHKAGPMFEHRVDLLLLSADARQSSAHTAAWWPVVRDAEGQVVWARGRPDKEDELPWWRDPEHRFLGDEGPSIQEAHEAVKFDYMFAPLPRGSSSMVMYSAPATLPKGGRIEVEGRDEPVCRASEDSFVFLADFFPQTAWPHEATLVVWDRESKEASEYPIRQAPRLLDAEGKGITTGDGGEKLGSWWADDAHSFVTRMGSFGY